MLESRTLFLNDQSFNSSKLYNLAKLVIENFKQGHRLAFIGNGGSAAEAMHLAAEFTGKCVNAHEPLPALCLNESQSALTAIANDYGVEHIFSRQVRANLVEGDILIALSTSGKSPNIVNALNEAAKLGVTPILWMGNFEAPKITGEIWKVPSTSTPRIQEIHLVWGHVLAEVVENAWIKNFQ